jgi:PAS domain S-box-containing protein
VTARARDTKKRSTSASEEALAHLAAIIESSNDAIVSKTLGGIVTSWNTSAERMFGYSAEEMIGQSILTIIPVDRRDEEKEILARLVRGERIEHFETLRRRKNGTLVEVSLTISPVRDRKGQIIGASKIARDITEQRHGHDELARMYRVAQNEVEERKKAEERIRELNQLLESRVLDRTAELESFSYTIAHDLRAPLRAIHRYSDLLREDYAHRLDGDALMYLRRLAAGAARMDRLIEDLLKYSRVARAEIDLRPVDLTPLMTELRAQTEGEFEERSAQLTVQDGMPAVLGHRVLLTHAIYNLLSNALKFVPPGTRPDVRIDAEHRDGKVRLNIRDNGTGIDPRYHDRIFRIFEQLDPSESFPGTGVGLAITKKAVERMNGRVGVNSELGSGSCFWIELPSA